MPIYSLCIRHEVDNPKLIFDDHYCSFVESDDKQARWYIEYVLFDEDFHDYLKDSMMHPSYMHLTVHKDNDRGDESELLCHYYSSDVLKSIEDKEMDLYE